MRLTTALAGLIGGAVLVLACFVGGDALRWAGLAAVIATVVLARR